MRPRRDLSPDLARVTVADRRSSRASSCASSSSSPTAGRASARCRPVARPGARRRWRRRSRPAGTACSPSSASYLDEFWERRRRRARGRRRAPAGGALRAVPRAPGRRAGRAAADPAKGLTGPGLRRAHVLGHRDRSCCRCSPTPRPTAAARRAALAALDARRWPDERARSSSAWRAPRSRGARSTARSARATGPPAPRRSTSTPTSPTRSSATCDATGRRGFERDVGLELLVETARLWRSLGHHDAAGGFRIDGVTGPGRVQRDRRQQRLHEPDGAAEPARAPPTRSSATRTRRGELGVDDRGGGRLARRRRGDVHPLRRRRSACTRRPRASPSTSAWDFEAHAPDHYPLLLHFPYFDLYRKQVVKQADLVLAHAPARRRLHRRAEGAQLRLLRARSPCATRRCRRAPRR